MSYMDSGQYTDSDIERRRRMAMAMMAGAQGGEPIASGWQGAAKLAQALIGGLSYARAGKEEKASNQALSDALLGLVGGGGAAAPSVEAGAPAGGGIGSDYAGGQPYDLAMATNLIRQGAMQRGMDPDTVVRGFQAEGLKPNTYQSNSKYHGGRERSYGPLQLFIDGGVGNEFMQKTGLDPRDPKTVPQQIAFGLDVLKQRGWTPWNGPTKQLGYGQWQGINRGQAGGAPQDMAGAALPNVEPVGSAPTPDVAAFLQQPAQQPPSLAERQALIRQVLGGAKESPADVAAEVRKYYANEPTPDVMAYLGNQPRTVYPEPPPPVQPPQRAGMGALTGTGTRPAEDYSNPATMMTPAPIGRGPMAQPVPGTPMPTRPTVTGYPNVPPVQAPPVAPPPLGGGTPVPAVAAPSPQAQMPQLADASRPQPGYPPPQQAPMAMQADMARMPQPRPEPPTVLPYASGADPRTPRPRPTVLPIIPARPPIQPPAPAAPSTPAVAPQSQPAAGPQVQPSAPAIPLSPQRPAAGPITNDQAMGAQEFARQGQNYLQGIQAFPGQRVRPQGLQTGAPAPQPQQPRQGLIQGLMGGGGSQGAGMAQGAPTGSPVAGGDRRSALAALIANPRVPVQMKLWAAQQLEPKPQGIMSGGPGTTFFDPNKGEPVYTVPAAPDKGTTDQQDFAAGEKNPNFRKYELEKTRAGASKIDIGGGSDKQIFDAMNESATSARAAVTGLNSIREARNAVKAGGIFGAGADMRLGLQKVGALLGLANPQAIQNTETFRSAIAPQVAALMKATVGSTQISNADREFAAKAAGGDINLDQGSIERLIGIMENANSVIVKAHMDKLNKVYPESGGFERERSLFGVEAPLVQEQASPMPQGTSSAPGKPLIYNPETGEFE